MNRRGFLSLLPIVTLPERFTPTELSGSAMAHHRELGRAKFRNFVRYAWPVVEPAHLFVPNWHIDAIADHLQAVAEGQIKRLLINVPPGHAKSLIVSVLFPAWMWIRKPDGGRWRALFASYAEALAMRDSVRCRDLMRSQWYQYTYQPTWKFSRDQDEKGLFMNSEKGIRQALGVTGKGTGYRGDCMVADDPLNAIDAYSDAALEFHVNWWDLAMSSRLNDMATGCRVIIMQRLSDRDLSGHVLRAGGYEHLKLPTRFEVDEINRSTIGFRDKRKVAGELLFASMFPEEVVAQAEKDMGSAGFAGQHQQRPMPAGGGMLKKHWWRYWEPKGARLPPVAVKMPDGSIDMRQPVELPARFDQTIQSWDMAFKDTKTSDYVVGIVMSALGGDRYMRAIVRDRMDLPRTLLEVRTLSGVWPEAMLKLVEDKANGPAVVQSLRHEIGGFLEVNPEGGKVSRAAAASPQLESGNWFLPHPKIAPWVDAFISECAAFPAGVNDDQVDAWSQGANRLLPLVGKKPAPKVPQDRPRGERSWMA